jgi:glutamate racemase
MFEITSARTTPPYPAVHLESSAALSSPAPPPRERPIAVFDSGVGGLTVLQELLVELPHEDFLYLGDTANFPYGERSAQELEGFALEIAEHLLARRAKLLVVACNALSSAALGALRERMLETTLGVDVIGVIEPESRIAAQTSVNRRIGLLATTATVRSGAYDRALRAHAPDATLTSVAAPDLAPMIQEGFPVDRRVVEAVRGYCAPLREADVDTVILGCTHYPLVAPMLQRMLGPGVSLISSGRALALSVAASLELAGLSSPATGEGDYRFLCTGDVEAFRTVGSRFLQLPIEQIEHVALGAPVAA